MTETGRSEDFYFQKWHRPAAACRRSHSRHDKPRSVFGTRSLVPELKTFPQIIQPRKHSIFQRVGENDRVA